MLQGMLQHMLRICRHNDTETESNYFYDLHNTIYFDV